MGTAEARSGKLFRLEGTGLDLAVEPMSGYKQGGFCQAIAGRKDFPAKAVGRHTIGKALQGFRANGLRAGEGQAPTGQVQAFQLFIGHPPATEHIGEIRAARAGHPVLADSLQPACRTGKEELRCHHVGTVAMQDRQQQTRHQSHVVKQRQPGHPDIVVSGLEGLCHGVFVGHQVGVGHHDALGCRG